MDPKRWIKVGQDVDKRSLETAAKELTVRWPGRYDLEIKVAHPSPAARHYSLYLRHR